MTAQLRHTGIVATIAWTPLALALLDRALAPPDASSGCPAAQHARRLVAFAIVLGAQTLSGFPQAVYAALMAYAVWSIGRLASWPLDARARFPWARVSALALGFGVACALGLLWVPRRSCRRASSPRCPTARGRSWSFASHATYWPRAALSFLLPHINGDASDGTYRGPDLFWESYGYVGLATAALAVGAAVAGWRGRVERTLLAVAALAYLFVLGANTPFYRLAWEHLPAFRGFRFPTRFLFLVEIALVTLAALGLTRFERWYAAPRQLRAPSQRPPRWSPSWCSTSARGSRGRTPSCRAPRGSRPRRARALSAARRSSGASCRWAPPRRTSRPTTAAPAGARSTPSSRSASRSSPTPRRSGASTPPTAITRSPCEARSSCGGSTACSSAGSAGGCTTSIRPASWRAPSSPRCSRCRG
nr:hypothetical protein [Deltaproteobacteria bacterium]